jgi:hypothetical protein
LHKYGSKIIVETFHDEQFLLEMISNENYTDSLINFIPENMKTREVLLKCTGVLASNMMTRFFTGPWSFDIDLLLRNKHKIELLALAFKIIRTNGSVLFPLKIYYEMMTYQPSIFRYITEVIPDDMKEYFYRRALELNGLNLAYVPVESRTKELCLIALSKKYTDKEKREFGIFGTMNKYIPERLKHSLEIMTLLKLNEDHLQELKNTERSRPKYLRYILHTLATV